MVWATTRKQLSTQPAPHMLNSSHPHKSWMHWGQSGKFCSLIIQRGNAAAHTKLARRPRANKIAHKNEFIWVVHMCTAGQDNGLIYNADTKLAYSVILGCVGGDLHAEKFHVRYIAMWVHPAVVASRIFWQQLKLFSWEIWSTPPILRILPKKKSSHGDQQFAEIHMNMV